MFRSSLSLFLSLFPSFSLFLCFARRRCPGRCRVGWFRRPAVKEGCGKKKEQKKEEIIHGFRRWEAFAIRLYLPSCLLSPPLSPLCALPSPLTVAPTPPHTLIFHVITLCPQLVTSRNKTALRPEVHKNYKCTAYDSKPRTHVCRKVVRTGLPVHPLSGLCIASGLDSGRAFSSSARQPGCSVAGHHTHRAAVLESCNKQHHTDMPSPEDDPLVGNKRYGSVMSTPNINKLADDSGAHSAKFNRSSSVGPGMTASNLNPQQRNRRALYVNLPFFR